jgi:sialidase-1
MMSVHPFLEQVDVFGVEGDDAHRIPVMVISTRGTILAFCNRRIGSAADQGHDSHVVLRRSLDGGKTWLPTQVICARQGWVGSISNAVVDHVDGSVMILYSKMVTVADITQTEGIEGTKRHLTHGHPDAGEWISRSTDDGETWTEERCDLQPNSDGVMLYAHGNGPTLQLRLGPRSGRLVIPAWGWTEPIDQGKYFRSGVIYSDDHGLSWKVGGLAAPGTDECCILETADGVIYMNSRQGERKWGQRTQAWSVDGGETFTDLTDWDQSEIDPSGDCEASLTRFSEATTGDRNRVLYADPASAKRLRMTVRVSYDECRTWTVSKLINEGPSAYSSLAVTDNGTILCLYERGASGPYEKITMARFNIEWLEG